MPLEVRVPSLGESIYEVRIVRWLKQPGESVKKDEPLVELETEKATVELPALAGGTLESTSKKDGDFAEVGAVIGHIAPLVEQGAPAIAPVAATTAAVEQMPNERAKAPELATTAPAEKPAHADGDTPARVMPAAARLLAESGIKPETVEPTGPGGRVLKEDVLRRLAQDAKSPSPASSPAAERTPLTRRTPHEAPSGDREEEIVPMSMIRTAIARRLVEAQQQAALLTTFNEADMSAVMEMRGRYRDEFQKKHEAKLGFMSFFVKASVEALKRFPQVNAEIRGRNIAYRNYYDIGVAVGGGKGLVVPVLRNAERMSFADIERSIEDFARRAAANKLKPEELEGGTFTISNGGIYGSLLSTPIVNPPQSGILGLHAIQDRPVARQGEVVIRPMMYLALSYDHRLVDGREAVGFLRTIKEAIEDPTRIILEI